jgi:hypothetical protein
LNWKSNILRRLINGDKMNKIFYFFLITFLLASCGPQTPQAESGLPVSWFDSPLPGTIVEANPGPPNNEFDSELPAVQSGLPAVQVVSHHSDPSGIAEIEFSVNGEVFEGTPGPPNNESLVTDTRDWIPPGPGEYVLQVRALSISGQWGEYAETYVIVPGLAELQVGGVVEGVVYAGLSQSPLDGVAVTLKGCGLDQTQATASDGAFLFSGLPAGSCTLEVFKQDWGFVASIPDLGQYPVPVASDPNLPTALSLIMDITDPFPEQTGFSDKSLDTNIVYTGSCSPNQVTFRVRAMHPDGIRGVTFFFRVQQNGQSTPWSNGQAMNSVGDGFYQLLLTGNHLENDSGFVQATVFYQFVIEPTGAQLADFVRSQVYSDLTLLACGQEPPPPPPPPPPGITPYPCEPWPACWVPH